MLQNVGFVHADWVLNTIYNESDLQLDGAYRLKDGKRYATYIDKKIKSATPKPVTMVDYRNLTYPKSQGLLCITLTNKSTGERYELFFDSQPSHSIAWQRPKAKKITLDPQGATDDTAHYARVFLKLQGYDKASAKFGYDGEALDQALDLIIHGTAGAYTLELGEPTR